MSFKSKTIGIIAGTALTLSIASGAVAAPGSTTADLDPNEAGKCFAAAAAGDINLGTWEWDGSAYVYESGTAGGDITFQITQTYQPTPAYLCAVTVQVSDLTNSTDTILASNVTLTANSGVTGTAPAYTVTTPTGSTGANLVLTASLGGAIPNDITSGTYTGNITVTNLTAAT